MIRSHATPTMRAHGRASLLEALEHPALVGGLMIASDGRFVVERIEWAEYWRHVPTLGDSDVIERLAGLREIWTEYVCRRFPHSLRRLYCYAYFFLLEAVVESHARHTSLAAWKHALHATLAFECFSITSADSAIEATAAGTSTARNPCYLLAKLKMPSGPDDTRFHPIITAPPPSRPVNLYYHYRQLSLSADAEVSLLFYLETDLAQRNSSFRLVNALLKSLSMAVEPRARERSARLVDKIIGPWVQSEWNKGSAGQTLEFVEVGSGSGSLTAGLCRRLLSALDQSTREVTLNLRFVDLDLAEPTRFFTAAPLQRQTDSLTFIASDYRE